MNTSINMETCSVCANNVETLGGRLLWERNSKITAICEDCWFGFSNVDPHKRTCSGKAQQMALQENIGVESQLFSRPMNPRKSFSDNVKDAVAKGHSIQHHPFA